ncbi:hypothetical protein PM082_011930 [Marasmius tenuissimus]|nr:hypothetical protein PM082_011930 [Marasmius tenuissimus]
MVQNQWLSSINHAITFAIALSDDYFLSSPGTSGLILLPLVLSKVCRLPPPRLPPSSRGPAIAVSRRDPDIFWCFRMFHVVLSRVMLPFGALPSIWVTSLQKSMCVREPPVSVIEDEMESKMLRGNNPKIGEKPKIRNGWVITELACMIWELVLE